MYTCNKDVVTWNNKIKTLLFVDLFVICDLYGIDIVSDNLIIFT